MTEQLRENQVAVFGGEGNMGKVTVDLFQNLGYEAISPDPKNPDSIKSSEAVQASRVVFFSVLPIEEIIKIVDETEDSFTPDHIVLDNASVKKPLEEAYRRLEAKGVSICSTHPLCKHDQPLHGQKALVLDVGSNPDTARMLAEDLYRNAGMITIPLSFESHDKTMTVVQLVPHMVMRSVADALEKSGVNVQTLREIAPANFQLFNLSMWRTIIQDPRISATIISNLLKNEEGQALAEKIEESIAQVVAGEETQELTEAFERTYASVNQDGIGPQMNEVTTTVLERLANLQVKSITLETQEDRPGLLRELLLPYEEEGINITAIDSHIRKPGVKFEIGVDEKTASPDALASVVAKLKAMGCEVRDINFSE